MDDASDWLHASILNPRAPKIKKRAVNRCGYNRHKNAGLRSRAFVAIISTAIHSPLFDPWRPPVQYRRMEPIRSIVHAYVRRRDRKALDDLRAHRGRLIAELRLLSWGYDMSKPIARIQNEIAIIEAGLAKLNTATAA